MSPEEQEEAWHLSQEAWKKKHYTFLCSVFCGSCGVPFPNKRYDASAGAPLLKKTARLDSSSVFSQNSRRTHARTWGVSSLLIRRVLAAGIATNAARRIRSGPPRILWGGNDPDLALRGLHTLGTI